MPPSSHCHRKDINSFTTVNESADGVTEVSIGGWQFAGNQKSKTDELGGDCQKERMQTIILCVHFKYDYKEISLIPNPEIKNKKA